MPQIHLENVSKFYDRWGKRQLMPAVSDVNLTIKQGEFVFVIGSSGAGKSTLLKLMSGELSPTYGTVSINRLKITRMSRKSKWLRR